jgi:hypothetical protein
MPALFRALAQALPRHMRHSGLASRLFVAREACQQNERLSIGHYTNAEPTNFGVLRVVRSSVGGRLQGFHLAISGRVGSHVVIARGNGVAAL